jgi:dUTP pyrophosphatase
MQQQTDTRFVKLNKKAIKPTRATRGSCGYDLKTLNSVVIPAREKVTIETGIGIIDMPSTMCALIWPKSGRSHKLSCDILGGVVDSDYDGSEAQDVRVIYFNNLNESIKFEAGESIAQLILQQYYITNDDEVDADRDGGFGSTNK